MLSFDAIEENLISMLRHTDLPGWRVLVVQMPREQFEILHAADRARGPGELDLPPHWLNWLYRGEIVRLEPLGEPEP